ncbi:MAG: CBS domain-containing protein [Chitinophagaceae bacterium]|nr:CBS domain-containing protein [Chitinophagaceae bacterium]
MKKREPVKHIMTENVLSVKEEDNLKDVVALFRKHTFRHLPVTKGHEITGIISSTDINRLTFGALFENQEGADDAVLEMLSVPQVMTHKPQVIDTEMTIKEVAELFATQGFHALPVVEGKELKGIVTTTDVIKYMLEQY